MSINDVLHFLAIFDLSTYLVPPYNVRFGGLFWTPLPTLISDAINGRSLTSNKYSGAHCSWHVLFLAGNQGNHQNLVPCMLTYKVD
jgi:hypothetical protein